MIPSIMIKELLNDLLCKLTTQEGEPDYKTHNADCLVEKRYRDFCDLLHSGEEDLSIVLSLLEKDPDCQDQKPAQRLQALVDYVKIACAIYASPEPLPKRSTIH